MVGVGVIVRVRVRVRDVVTVRIKVWVEVDVRVEDRSWVSVVTLEGFSRNSREFRHNSRPMSGSCKRDVMAANPIFDKIISCPFPVLSSMLGSSIISLGWDWDWDWDWGYG